MAKKQVTPTEETISEDLVGQELDLTSEVTPTEETISEDTKAEQLEALAELAKLPTPGHPSRDLGKTRN